MAANKGKGKKRIPMKKIDNEDSRMITFSKRKNGIYKKANELISMCNAEVGVLVFSKAGAPFTFAHPSMEAVINRFMNPNQQFEKDNAELLSNAYRKECINQLNEEHEKLVDTLQMEKDREKALQKISSEMRIEKYWWKTPVEDLSSDVLQKIHETFVELNDALCDIVNEHSCQLGGEGSSSPM